jgi:hypothetical protein
MQTRLFGELRVIRRMLHRISQKLDVVAAEGLIEMAWIDDMRAIILAIAFLCLGVGQGRAEPIDAVHGFMGSAPWLQRAMRDVGRNPTGMSHKWCGRQMAMWIGKGGNTAISYRSVGRPSGARVGAIAVMAHHVGIVTSVGPGYVTLVSGNHSGKSGRRVVGIGRYPISRILAFRWP